MTLTSDYRYQVLEASYEPRTLSSTYGFNNLEELAEYIVPLLKDTGGSLLPSKTYYVWKRIDGKIELADSFIKKLFEV